MSIHSLEELSDERLRASRSDPTPIKEFERRLRELGSQKALAENLGVSEQLIGKIVKGYRSISLELAERLGFELVWRKRE